MDILRPPMPDELAALTALCLRSKAFWGYDAAFMAACRDELTLTDADLQDAVIVATAGETRLGMAQVSFDGDACHLEKLFVEPTHMGAGTGRRLFAWALQAARGRGAKEMIVEADPGAVPFYTRMGCCPAGTAASGSIPGRTLPRLIHGLI